MTTHHQAHFGSVTSIFLAFFLFTQCLFLCHSFAETTQTETVYPALRGIALLTGSTGGDQLVGIDYENGDASFNRLPIELMAFWRYKQFRTCGGITHHFNPKLEIDFDGNSDIATVKFNHANGLIMQTDYYYSDQFGVGLKLTDIEYKTRQPGQKIDGDSIGVVGSYLF